MLYRKSGFVVSVKNLCRPVVFWPHRLYKPKKHLPHFLPFRIETALITCYLSGYALGPFSDLTGNSCPLQPYYASTGRVHRAHVGKLYIMAVAVDDYLGQRPRSALDCHGAGRMKVYGLCQTYRDSIVQI